VPAVTTEPKPSNPFAGASAGYLPLSGVIVGFGGGWLVDRAAGTLPLWTLVLGVVFTAAGVYHMVREAKR
jgi:F0F1-type ATP synthase assembly protein I